MPVVMSRILLKLQSVWNVKFRFQQCRHFKRKADQTSKGFTPKDQGSDKSEVSDKLGAIVKARFKQDSLEHIDVQYKGRVEVSFRTALRPFLFAIGFTGCSFAGAALWQYEDMRKAAMKSFFGSSRYNDMFQVPKYGHYREKINKWWNSLPEGRKLAAGIIGVNVIVFLGWRVPALQHTMLKWFTSNPASKAVCLPMVFSMFSHYSLWHIAINMYVLWSFAATAGAMFGKEQFLAMYLSTGVWASFASHLNKIAISRFNPSLGASGAIMAVLGAVCAKYPDSQLQIIFLPFFSFSAGTGMMGIIGLETAGTLLRWQFFDHAGHLAGILAGWYYVKYGYAQIWGSREPLMRFWHSIRGPPKET
ncbi:presenilin-associated rhomboid-like protein, mitochondrial [Glandiceps talaboti]